MNYELIKVSAEASVGLITFLRPEKHNSLSFQMISEIGSALEDFEQREDIRTVILAGNDRAFSTGADLNEAVATTTPWDLFRYNRKWRSLTYGIEHLLKPVIAAIEGYCLTGGLELALACDMRIAGEGSTFAITSSKIGSVAGAGGTQRLPRLVGPAAAKEMMFTANFITAEEAFRIGLVNRVVPPGMSLKAAMEMAETIAQRAPLSIAWIKRAVNTGLNMDLESALDFEASLSAQAFTTSDKREGMMAFLEGRRAEFRGQ